MYTEYLGIHFYGVRPAKKKRHPLPGVPGIPAFPGRVPLCIFRITVPRLRDRSVN